MEDLNDDNNNETSVQCTVSNNHKYLVKTIAHGLHYESEPSISSEDQLVEDNMTPGQEPVSSWVPHVNGESIGKCCKSNGKSENESDFLAESETNNNNSGPFSCCDYSVSSISSSPTTVNNNVKPEEISNINVTEEKAVSTIALYEHKQDDSIRNSNIENFTNGDESEKLPHNKTTLPTQDLSVCSNDEHPENIQSDADNACSLALLHDIHSLVQSCQQDLSSACAYTEECCTLFKKCSNYKKLPNEYVNHNIRRNRLLVDWMSHNCVHLEWNIVDEVSDKDWIGLYRLGKSFKVLYLTA